MTALSLALAFVLAAPCGQATAPGEPCDLPESGLAPYAGTLTAPDAWRIAAQKRLDLEAQVAELQARPCADAGGGLTWGLVSGALLVGAGVALGVVLAR